MSNKLAIVRCEIETFPNLGINNQSLELFKKSIEDHSFSNKLNNLSDKVFLFENSRESTTYHLKIFNDQHGSIQFSADLPKSLSSPFKVFLNVSKGDALKYLQNTDTGSSPHILIDENGIEVVKFTNTVIDVSPKENQNVLGRDEISRLINNAKNVNIQRNYLVINGSLEEF